MKIYLPLGIAIVWFEYRYPRRDWVISKYKGRHVGVYYVATSHPAGYNTSAPIIRGIGKSPREAFITMASNVKQGIDEE